MTSPNAWTEEQLSELAYLRVVEGWSYPQIALRLRKSVDACKARLAVQEGRKVCNPPRDPNAPKAVAFTASFEVPAHRKNDHAKHLGLILKIHRGGFPVCGRRGA